MKNKLGFKRIGEQKGFTLVEVLVSMFIIVIISVMVVAGMMSAQNLRNKDYTSRNDAQAVEADIAARATPSSIKNLDLAVGNYEIPSESRTFTTGGRSYTTMAPGKGGMGDPMELDGDEYFSASYRVQSSGRYLIECWGASGGGAAGQGGKGGYTSGIVRLKKGDMLYLKAGEAGHFHYGSTDYKWFGPNQGGGGRVATSGQNGADSGGCSGGGASDVRINTDNLYARVIVAAGGGGAGLENNNQIPARGGRVPGGIAGGLSGGNASTVSSFNNMAYGLGATQNAGGALGSGQNQSYSNYGFIASSGTFGVGGSGVGNREGGRGGAGGGGGWYGGGGGNTNAAGGGSSWVFTAASFSAWTNMADKNNWLLPSTYYLVDTKLLAGNASMPNPRAGNSPMTGMNGNGYVRLSWVGR